MDKDFEIDERILEIARKRDFIKLQDEMRRQEKIGEILICFKNGICPRCGEEQVLAEGGYSDRHYIIYRCSKCKLKILDSD